MPSLFVRNVAGDWFGVTCLLVYTKKEDFALSYIGKLYFLFPGILVHIISQMISREIF